MNGIFLVAGCNEYKQNFIRTKNYYLEY